MDVAVRHVDQLEGAVTLPPDKAICHRAVLLASIATGATHIRPWPEADDCQQSLQLVESLGIRTERSPQEIVIHGAGFEGLRAPTAALSCGESGTTLRLAAGLLAGQPFSTTLTAGPSLRQRPMQRIVEPLTQMGADVQGRVADRLSEVYPPLSILGRRPLRAIRYTLPVASAQVKSAVLFAGLFAAGRTTVVEPIPTRDHTERMLRYFGAAVRTEDSAVSLEPSRLTSPKAVVLPADFSSAAFFIVAASCVPGARLTLREVNVNPTRTGLLKILERMGAAVSIEQTKDTWEPRGTIIVEARSLRGTVIEAKEVPSVIDELPVLMVAATAAKGLTRFDGIGELRVKETDRIQSMVTGLRQLGAQISLPAPDVLEMAGGPLTGGEVASMGDHRTAMSLAVAGLLARGTTTIHNAECVAKSFPTFFDHLRQVAQSATGKSVDKAEGLC